MGPRRLLVFVVLVTAIGSLVVARAIAAIPSLSFNAYAVVLAVLTVGTSRFTIKVPGRPATVSVSEVFVFASVLMFGPAPATLTVAFDGAWASLTQHNRRFDRFLFNVTEPAISTWTAGVTYFAIARFAEAHGVTPAPMFATIGMTAVFFVLNSGLTALAVALENGWSTYEVWSRHAWPLAINYYSAAAVASLAVANNGRIDFHVVGLVVPLLVLSYAAYKEAARRVDEAKLHVQEVERLYTEARKRDDELRQSQKLEAIGRLAGGVAHDFNNLLTAIRGYAELLRDGLNSDDPRRDDADQILQASDRAVGLTRQLLSFSRRQTIAPQVFPLARVILDTEKMLRRLIGEDIQLTTLIDPNAGSVRADPGQVEQVLMNLAVNARDAMPDGGELRLQLAGVTFDESSLHRPASLAPGHYLRLSVIDTGCGMSEDVVSHVFEPFFTTKERGRGTGLGLSTVYGIVDGAGGAIEVVTQIGHGTTFHVYLPEEIATTAAGGADVGPVAPVRASETVLLVEDEVTVARLLANTLTKAGYKVIQTGNADEALAAARSHEAPIHLMLTDVVMPGMNGRELADRIVRIRRNMRVLFMSGYTDDALLDRGVKTNSVHFIQKPFRMETLAVKIREVLAAQPATSSDENDRGDIRSTQI